jgi:hypothetical protein
MNRITPPIRDQGGMSPIEQALRLVRSDEAHFLPR